MRDSPVRNVLDEQEIDISEFSKGFDANAKVVARTIAEYGFDLRIVGGAVRDFLRGKPPRDIDFATNAEPAELMFIFDLEGIEHDDSGISHGTIKAKFRDQKVDVTSISYKLDIKDGLVRIHRSMSWREDSLRRDLTINSMSVDMNGNLYDYQNGLEDLKNQMVRFCPHAQEKIRTDPYTILRWFKAIAMFDRPKWMKSDRKLVERNAKLVTRIKDEDRTKWLIADLVTSAKWDQIRQLMCDTGVADYIDLTCGD